MIKQINFVSKFRKANIFSISFFIISVIFIIFKGLNYGIDFKGGTLIELRTENPVNASLIRDSLNSMSLGDVNVKKFGKEGDYLIKVEQKNTNNSNLIEKIKNTLAENLNTNVDRLVPTREEVQKIQQQQMMMQQMQAEQEAANLQEDGTPQGGRQDNIISPRPNGQ